MQKTITGFFTKEDIIYEDATTSFYISRFQTEEGNIIKIKGTFEGGIPEGMLMLKVKKEEEYKGSITYVIEPDIKYMIPEKKSSIITYLGNITKMSLVQSSKVLNYYTKDGALPFFEELDKDEEKIEIRNIHKLFRKESKIDELIELLRNEKYKRKVRSFLYEYGFKESQVAKIFDDEYFAEMGEGIILEVKRNPFNLLKIKGITFLQIDSIFLDSGGELSNPNRIYSGILYYLYEHCNSVYGTYIEMNELLKLISLKLNLNFSPDIFLSYIKNLQSDKISEIKDLKLLGSLKVVKYDGRFWVFPFSYYVREQYIIKRVKNLLNLNDRDGLEKIDINIKETIKEDKIKEDKIKEKFILEQKHKNIGAININEDQIQAIETCFNYQFSIIKGYGGTGKSTIIKKIVDVAREKGMTYTLLAPTGKAVDVLIKASGDPASCFTIHRKIGLLEEGLIGDTSLKEIKEEIVLIDESSMIATPLMYSLLSCIGDTTTIVFIGDNNQLRPVGIGEPFLNMIESKLIPETHLTKIYRQSEDSLILENSKNLAEMKELQYRETDDWKFFDIIGKQEKVIKNLVIEQIKQKGFSKDDDIVISAKYNGDAGINILNQEIQGFLQEGNKKVYQKGLFKFHLNDRVMNLSNNYFKEENHRDDEFIFGLPLDFLTNEKDIDKIYLKYRGAIGKKDSILKKICYNKTNKMYFLLEKINIDEETGKTVPIFQKIAHYSENNNLILKEEEVNDTDFPELSIFNGNYGEIIALKDIENDEWWTESGKEIKIDMGRYRNFFALVNLGDKFFFIHESNLKATTLFYASTVHKMQGSQFKKVYAICSPRDFFMIDRNWLYTMMSRAKDMLMFFSNPNYIKKVQFKQGMKRKSFLPIFLSQILQEREKYKL